MPVLIQIGVQLALPDNLMQDARDKVTVRGGRQISFLIRDIRVHDRMCELVRVCLCILARAHA